MYVETVRHYSDKSVYDYSCSETMLIAADRYYKLNLPSDAFHMMAPFSGGMKVEGTCGALTGGLAVLGILFTRDRAHDSPLLGELTQEFLSRFMASRGSLDCSQLKAAYRTEETGCLEIVLEAARLLETLIEREAHQITRLRTG